MRSILWQNSDTHETQIWFMNGHKRTGRATVVDENGDRTVVGPPWNIVGAIFDPFVFGRPNILWHNSSTNETQIWGMFNHAVNHRATVVDEQRHPTVVGPPWSIVATRDDKPAVVWQNSDTHETQIWFMNDHVRTGRATVVDENGDRTVVGHPWNIVGAGNFNGDGKDDILWQNSDTHETQIWFMNGHKRTGRATVVDENGDRTVVGHPWNIVGAGNFNGDGKDDILWQNSDTHETQIWFMNGHKRTGRATVVDENGDRTVVGPPWNIVATSFFTQDRVSPDPNAPH
ncbi:FG-GAP repeat domain-containing protein [Streptomyces agglomeratus]|uniref:FG-GAP repeat domain-containing protein n=1 Tax=Streptomyces agglomeratus TaxID=285458 RepID=UPI000A64D8DB|nr:VCBS repeat-containing protein [Streptomyces agglomeratus]